MEKYVSKLQQWSNQFAAQPDFKDPAVLQQVREVADRLLADGLSHTELTQLERLACSPEVKPTISSAVQLAVKDAKSKVALRDRAFRVSIILPAYGENIRLMPRGDGPGQHPSGENFVVEKSKQLEWLFGGSTSSYEVYVIDDMSKAEPETSGDAVARVVREQSIPHFSVLYLADGVQHEKAGHDLVAAALRGVELPKNSRKAGAVYYGMAKAIQANGQDDDHIVVLTDCDLSVDLGQLGNLALPIVSGDAVAVAGSRRLPESILEIEASRNIRANAARYFRELLLPGLLPRDTQCGAKAFAAGALAKVLESGLEVLDFSFDIELLTKFALLFSPSGIVPVAVAWFDSSELTTTDSSVHWSIMRAQLAIATSNRTGSGEVFEQTVQVASKLAASEDVWLRFLDRIKDLPDVLKGLQEFDPSLLPALDRLSD